MAAGKSRIGRPSRGSRGGGESSRTLYETYVKKLSESFFNDITLRLQSGDVDIGSDSFIHYAVKTTSEVKKRKIKTWGIMPTRVVVDGVGDFNGSYVIKEIRNQLDRSGGFQTTLGLVTTDEFLQKGVRITSAIVNVLGSGFLDRYISKFSYHINEPLTIRNTEIAFNVDSLKEKRGVGERAINYLTGKQYDAAGYAVISADAKNDSNAARMILEIRDLFGFGGDLTEHIFRSGDDPVQVASNAMNSNVMMHGEDTYTNFLFDEDVPLTSVIEEED